MPGPPKQAQFLTGTCPDEKCQTKLYFPSYNMSIECTDCGQRHEQQSILNVEPIKDLSAAMLPMLRNLLLGCRNMRKGPEMIKVLGLSNYHCRLVSPLLTHFGLDKRSGHAVPLRQISHRDTFDCCLLGDRAFLIDPQHIDVPGYGRDVSGSSYYLADTMGLINSFNDNEERLVPIHAEGDGHCLVHAVSRALVGREIFWHALRCNLKEHFEKNLHKYKEVLKDFVDEAEWQDIIAECDPDFQPAKEEPLGLRNIHVFGLANVLKRPIILLDSLQGMSSSGDYSAVFLPGLVPPHDCCGKSGELNKPLCLAWSSGSRSHYIPLVGVKEVPLPRFSRAHMPKVWGVSQYLLTQYINFHPGGWCIIGGDKCLNEKYISKLVSTMDEMFLQEHGVHPALVADVAHHIFRRSGIVGVHPSLAMNTAQKIVGEKRLFRCLSCDAVCEQRWRDDWLKPGGLLYNMAKEQYLDLKPEKFYQFPTQGLTCTYDPEEDELVPEKNQSQGVEQCVWCYSTKLRRVLGNNTVEYQNGDKTKSRSSGTRCHCGFKHWWDGEEYDNIPQQILATFNWSGKVVSEKVAWFQHETDASKNSNAYDVATKLVHKHFPGAFGSERIVQSVVDQILEQTKAPESQPESPPVTASHEAKVKEEPPAKMIITGMKTIHKEELGVSQTERHLKEKIQKHAAEEQSRATEERRRRMGEKEKQSKTSSSTATSKTIKIGTVSPSKEAIRKTKSENMVVRMVTSDGRQARLTLPKQASYVDLIKQIESVGNVNIEKVQKIMYGFPPQEIKPPLSEDDTPLPLENGDRIQVVMMSKEEKSPIREDVIIRGEAESDGVSFQQELLKRLDAMQKRDSKENLDAAITSLALTISLSGFNFWEYAQNNPHLFVRGGLFYKQMARDVGLIHGKHCELPVFSGKSFRYNAESDQLELCMEPLGHFPIRPGLDEKIKHMTSRSSSSPPPQQGFTAVTASCPEEKVPRSQVFTGPGYVLSAPAQPPPQELFTSAGLLPLESDDRGSVDDDMDLASPLEEEEPCEMDEEEKDKSKDSAEGVQ